MEMASRSIDLINKKKNCTCRTLFFLISKEQICMLFSFSLPSFSTTTIPFYTTKTSNFLVTHHFYGRIVVCAYQRFCLPCSCSLLFFDCRSFSPCWRSHSSFSHSLAAMKFSCFSSKESKFVSFVFNHSL